jgi:hypothetical protein
VYACARIRNVEVAEAEDHEEACTVDKVLGACSSRFDVLRGGRGMARLALRRILERCSAVDWSGLKREVSLHLLLCLAPLELTEAPTGSRRP